MSSETYPIIEFDADFPNELRPLIGGLLEDNKWLCPLWMQKVGVTYSDSDEFTMKWQLFRDYRTARLRVTSSILEYSDWEKRETMIHEIIHSFTIPLKTVIENAIEDLKPSEDVATILGRQIDKVMEQITQDFAFSIARKPS